MCFHISGSSFGKLGIISTQHGKMVYEQIFVFTLAAHILHFTHLTWHQGGKHHYKMVCAVGFLHITHVHAQKHERSNRNTNMCRARKIMAKTSVHECTWEHGLPLSLIFDQRVLLSETSVHAQDSGIVITV